MKRHLVLVGLPGAGKTTVGRRIAELLRTPFTDIDETVAAAAGMPVAEIFRAHGEARFRAVERAAMDGAMAAPPHVTAPGAGWIAQPGNLEAAKGALLVYLRIDPAVAAARLTGDATRPLLAGRNPAEKLAELLARRSTWYERSEYAVDAAAPADAVAKEIVRLSGLSRRP